MPDVGITIMFAFFFPVALEEGIHEMIRKGVVTRPPTPGLNQPEPNLSELIQELRQEIKNLRSTIENLEKRVVAKPGTRVAVVNLAGVFSRYHKAQAFKKELASALEPLQAKGAKLKSEEARLAQELKTATDSTKQRLERELLQLKRTLEDLDLEAKQQVGKKQQQQIAELYILVTKTVTQYAKDKRIDFVLGYGEFIDGDINAIANITRKMQGMDLGSTSPLYFDSAIDITGAITEILNKTAVDAP